MSKCGEPPLVMLTLFNNLGEPFGIANH